MRLMSFFGRFLPINWQHAGEGDYAHALKVIGEAEQLLYHVSAETLRQDLEALLDNAQLSDETMCFIRGRLSFARTVAQALRMQKLQHQTQLAEMLEYPDFAEDARSSEGAI